MISLRNVLLVALGILCHCSIAQAQEFQKQTPLNLTSTDPTPKSFRLVPPQQVLVLYEAESLEEIDPFSDGAGPEALEKLEAQLAQQVHDVKVLVRLYSTDNIKKIHVKIGTRLGGMDFAAYSFAFDQSESLPEPFKYARSGKTVVLTLGQIKGLTRYQAEVILEGPDGIRSEPAYFSSEP